MEKVRSLLRRYFPMIMVALIASMIGGVIAARILVDRPLLAEQTPQVQATAVAMPSSPNAVADVAERVAPAVVKVETVYKSRVRYADNPFFNDPFFRQFFGDFPQSGEETRQGLGSGFIFNAKEGYVLTNDHVVRGADSVRVMVKDFDKPLEAKVIGSDQTLDLAVLKIDAGGKRLPEVSFGDSSKIRVGEWVVAIGDPYGMDWTVTAGVISAKGRPLSFSDDSGRIRRYRDLIQTDAAINPGNSGGPLLNLAGQVIGINTAVNAAAQGIGFAIPINTAKDVLRDLIDHGKVARSYLGVSIADLTKEMAQALELTVSKGVVVMDVVAGSPAEKAGLQRYDVILEVNRAKVTTADQFVNLIQKQKIGATVALLVLRDNRTQIVTARVGEQP